MKRETAQANDHALTQYAIATLPEYVNIISQINNYFVDPSEENLVAIRKNAPVIRELWRICDDIVKALGDLKSKMEFSVVNSFNDSPEIQHEFKIQKGANSIKCDNTPDSMFQLMQRFCEQGFDPCALFSQCSALTSKKAAEAFGLSEQALLETHGDLFATHESSPRVKMI